MLNNKSNNLFYFDHYGILRFELGGKILLTFITEILAIWVCFILLSDWVFLNDTTPGLTILSIDVIFLSTTFIAIFFKDKYFDVHHTEMIKQIANLLFFVMIFLIILYYQPEDIDSKKRNDAEEKNSVYFYTNPVTMSYIFILVYMICFYVIFNSTK